MNKKGNIGVILIFFILVAVLLGAAFLAALVIGIVDMTTDEIIPEVEAIGMVGVVNVTEAAQYATQPLSSLISSFTWMGGVMYFIAVLGLVGLAFVYRLSGQKFLIVVFVIFALLIILLSILISNTYEEIYSTNDDLGLRLKEQVILSWLILRSPLVFSVVIFISGVLMFTGVNEEFV